MAIAAAGIGVVGLAAIPALTGGGLLAGLTGAATKGGGILQAGQQLFEDVATDTDVNADADETSDYTNDTQSFDLFDNTWGY